MAKASYMFSIRRGGKPVSGLRASILDSSGSLLGQSATDAHGHFMVRRNQSRNEPASLVISDADGHILLEERWTRKRNFTLDRGAPEPSGLPVRARETGALINEHHLTRIKRLLERYLSDKEVAGNYNNIIDRLLPPLFAAGDIVATSAAVLDGEPMAFQRFREQLLGIKPGFFKDRQSAVGRIGKSSFEQSSYPRRCLIGPDVYQQLVLATTMVSQNSHELNAFSAQLDLGLAGTRTLERLVNAALPLSGRLSPEESAHIAERHLTQLVDNLPGFTPWPPEPDGGGKPGIPGMPGIPGVPGTPGAPPIEDFIPDIDLCEIRRQECIPYVTDSPTTTYVEDNEGIYRIDSVSPSPAVIGEILTITGEYFDPNVLGVQFPACGGGSIVVTPETESDTQVTVRVPDGVTSGPIGLQILYATQELCGKVTPLYELGQPGYFESNSPTLGYLNVNGDQFVCVAPGDEITVEWFACPPGANVELRYGGGSWQSVDNSGESVFIAPPVNGEQDVTVRLRVSTSAATRLFSAVIHVVGTALSVVIQAVEFTQGIQTMFHTDGVPDNSLPLVAGKDTIVRVYVDVDRGGFNSDQMSVTGQIRIADEYLTLRPNNTDSNGDPLLNLTFSSFNEDDRSDTNGTLNFLIPSAICNRPLELKITIVGDHVCDPPPSDLRIETISFRDVPAMPVRIRRIEGRAGNSPSSGAATSNVTKAFTYLPTPATNILPLSGVHGVSWYVGQLGGYASNAGLWTLSQDIRWEHWGPFGVNFDGNIWVGLTARSNRGIMAWPDFWTCISHAADENESTISKTAHEICHCLRLGHVQNTGSESCNEWGMFDTTCEPSRYEGQLPDVPFRVRTLEAIDPSRDLMGYEMNSSRFLNPDFWLRVMDRIEDIWG